MQCNNIPISIRPLHNHQSLCRSLATHGCLCLVLEAHVLVQPDKSLLGLVPYRQKTFAS